MRLKQRLKSGISFQEEHGQVPEFEAREACVYANYTWVAWQELDWQERATSVAQYRMHNLIDAHVNDASTRASEINSARASESRRSGRR